MARVTRASAAATAQRDGKGAKGRAKGVKKEETHDEEEDVGVKQEQVTPDASSRRSSEQANIKKRRLPIAAAIEEVEVKAESGRRRKKAKREEEQSDEEPVVKKEDISAPPSTKSSRSRNSRVKKEEDEKDDFTASPSKASTLQSKKLKSYSQYSNKSPFPDFLHPTPSECKLAHKILSSLHGARVRPKEVVAPTSRAGCGDSASVLDALVRTILSQNTSDTNSSRAKRSMDAVYGRSDDWDAIVKGGKEKLQEAIKCGGLSQVKSKVIISILEQVREKYGTYSLNHLHDATNEEAMTEMLSFQGVGPKTASCVLLFSLKRESFAVDTHVHRITGLLGWRPKSASRDETHAHLDVMIPDEDKYGLHILLVTHGKKCEECRAGGKNVGKCELRKAFRKGKVDGEAGEEVKEEEEREIKKEKGRNHVKQEE